MRTVMQRLAIGLPLVAPTALAQPAAPAVPAWDMRAHCEMANRVMATESAFILRACIDQEERAATLIRRDWDGLPGPIRRTCLEQQRALRMSSYFILNACIEQEKGATRDLQRRP